MQSSRVIFVGGAVFLFLHPTAGAEAKNDICRQVRETFFYKPNRTRADADTSTTETYTRQMRTLARN